MKEIRLLRLHLEHFKGCQQFDLELNGRSASIYGGNATGKTTLYDALTWLLFGKDSRGQSTFEIKPLSRDGRVRDHGAITSVEATFQVREGKTVWETNLQRTYYEKWPAKRGQPPKSFEGNASDFFVDRAPVKKYVFEERVSQLADEELFRQLTDVTYFSGKLDWKARRNALFAVCEVPPDGVILERETRFVPLSQACENRLTVEDLVKKLLAERKGIVSTRSHIPVRLDECQRTLEELPEVNFDTLRRERDQRGVQKAAWEQELLELGEHIQLNRKKNQRAAVQNQLDKLENENTAHRFRQEAPTDDRRPVLETAMLHDKGQFLALTARIRQEQAVADTCKEKILQCRSQWNREAARALNGAVCPTCGQALPEDCAHQVQSQFDLARRSRQEQLVAESDRFKEQQATARANREQLIEAAVALEGKIARQEEILAGLPSGENLELEDLPGYGVQQTALRRKLATLDQEIAQLVQEGTGKREVLIGKIATLEQEIAAIEDALAQEAVREAAQRRMDALRRDAKEVGARLEEIDGLLELCEEFLRYKVPLIEDKINSRFHLVRFLLFIEQVNGNLADCCQVLVEGVPYPSLNNGARINAGLDIIQALSAYHGVRAPLFLDNAESVTKLLPVTAQTIRLVVSEADAKMRVEYED